MFGFFKLSGAPPKAYHYYRSTKDKREKAIIEDLYKRYDDLIRELSSGTSSNDGKQILSNSFNELSKYGIEKGYSDFLISLFYQY